MQTERKAEPAKPTQWWYVNWPDCKLFSDDYDGSLAEFYKNSAKAGLNPRLFDRGDRIVFEDDLKNSRNRISFFRSEAACDAVVLKAKQDAQKAKQDAQKAEQDKERKLDQFLAPYR